MRKSARVLSLCLLLALVLSLGMPAAFADDAAAPAGAEEQLPENGTPKAAVPTTPTEPDKDVQPTATKPVNTLAAPTADGARGCIIHNWETINTIEPTCTEYGKLEQKCTKCGQPRTVTNVFALPKGHDHTILVETKREATCTLVGWGVYKCTRCDDTVELTIPMKEHEFNASNVVHGFGSIDDNNHTVKCANCNFTWSVKHTIENVPEKPATCTEAGYSAGAYCVDGCGYDTRNVIAVNPDAHKWGATPVDGGDGKHYTVCIFNQEHKKDGEAHNYGDWETVEAATCSKAGSEKHSCVTCGAVETREIPATGEHNYGGWIVIKEPTCVDEGVEKRTCSVCGETDTRTISATGNHTYPAQKTDDWNKETHIYICAVCGKSVTEEHKLGPQQIYKAPTCTEPGSYKKDCDRCNYSEDHENEIPALGHQWDNGTVTKAATCGEAGVKTYTCTVCKATKTEAIPALDHDWGDWVNTGDGKTHVRVCANDPSHTEYQKHKMGPWEVVKHNTETTDGYMQRWCQADNCDYHETRVIKAGVPKTGDSSNILLYSGLCLAAVCGTAGVLVYVKRKKAE